MKKFNFIINLLKENYGWFFTAIVYAWLSSYYGFLLATIFFGGSFVISVIIVLTDDWAKEKFKIPPWTWAGAFMTIPLIGWAVYAEKPLWIVLITLIAAFIFSWYCYREDKIGK